MSYRIPRGSFWRLKEQQQYVMKVIGTAVEGGEVKGPIVMYEQQGVQCSEYSWTTENHFLEAFELDPYYGCRQELPVSDWFDVDDQCVPGIGEAIRNDVERQRIKDQ